jgi:hypothetical protein
LGIEYKSQSVPVNINYFDRVVAANPLSGTVQIMNADNPQEVINNSSSANLLLASIPLGASSDPRYLAAVEDRIYVSLRGEGSIAVIDAIGLRELDANSSTPKIDRIQLTPGAAPAYIVIDDNVAYVGDYRQGVIYVVDINPNSKSYNQLVQTLRIPGA